MYMAKWPLKRSIKLIEIRNKFEIPTIGEDRVSRGMADE